MHQITIDNLKTERTKKRMMITINGKKDMADAIILVVLEQIVIEVGEDKMYVIIADECTDVTGNDSIPVVIQYVNYLTGRILERTTGTVKVDNTTSEKFSDTVVHVLSLVNLDVK